MLVLQRGVSIKISISVSNRNVSKNSALLPLQTPNVGHSVENLPSKTLLVEAP